MGTKIFNFEFEKYEHVLPKPWEPEKLEILESSMFIVSILKS